MKDYGLKVRFEPKDRDKLLKKAYDLGFVTKEHDIPKIGAYIRHAALSSDYHFVKLEGIEEFVDGCMDIRKTGVLLNQLLKKIHERNLCEEELALENSPIGLDEIEAAIHLITDLKDSHKVVFDKVFDIYDIMNTLAKSGQVRL